MAQPTSRSMERYLRDAHMWTQIVGKIRLTQSPWINHSWHVTLYVTARWVAAVPIKPSAAFYSTDLREFILLYDAVREAKSPDDTLLDFLQTIYEAAAKLANWDRKSLERTT
jgi:Family of unknown function (DUF5996)